MLKSVDAILMASGFSRRFAQGDKLLYPFLGEPLILRTLRLFTKVEGVRRVLLVCANPEVAALASGLPIEVIHNARPELGQRESIRLGVQVSDAEGYLFCPCDQPFLDAEAIGAILRAGKAGRIALPIYEEKPRTPVLFSAAFSGELQALGEGESGKTVYRRHMGCVDKMTVDRPWAFWDIDTVEDIHRLEAYAMKALPQKFT